LNAQITQRTEQAARQFKESLDDDLNTAEALAAAFEYIREANIAMDAGEFLAGNRGPALEFLQRFDSIFDVLQTSQAAEYASDVQVEALIEARTQAKTAKDYALADQIRQQLLEQGIILEDTKGGVRWKRK
jgi:cysteinyl-tRNA synthetase